MSVPFGHILYQTDVLKGLGRVAVSPLMRKLKGAPDAPSEVTSLVPSVPEPLRSDYVQWTGAAEGTWDGQVPPHMFPHWGFPLLVKVLQGVPYPLPNVLNQGCRLQINGPVPAGESLLVRASLVGIEEEEHRARIHQRVVTGTADDPEALIADVYGVVRLGKSTSKRSAPDEPDDTEVASWSIGPKAGLEFALLTGDFNPIHWLAPYAKIAGFPTTILHGFASLALSFEQLGRGLSGGSESVRWIDVRFTAPVVLPAQVSLRVGDEVDGARSLRLLDGRGRVCMAGTFGVA